MGAEKDKPEMTIFISISGLYPLFEIKGFAATSGILSDGRS